MTEIAELNENESKKLRLKRAGFLAVLYEKGNNNLLVALESLLRKIKYENLWMIKNNDDGRHEARGKCDMADTLLSRIREEVDWAIDETKKLKPKKEKS